MKKIIIISFLSFVAFYVKAQYNMVNNNAQTINICAADFYDNSTGNYAANANQTITFKANTVNSGLKMSFNQFDVHTSDTLYVYDGPTIADPLIGKFNNTNSLSGGNNIVQTSIYNSTNATGGSLTFKFVTNASNQAAGWFASLACIPVCQSIIARLDSLTNDPLPNDSNYLDICLGDPITFAGKGLFPQNGIIYNQSNATCTYNWDFGDGTTGTGQVVNHTYTQRRGYDVMLKITDNIGCVSTNALGARVRVASFPTMHINPLPEMCSNETKIINVGYMQNSTVVVEPIGFTQISKQGFDSTMFIPDGPNCPTQVYNTFVVFNNFPPGVTILSATDILSICVNMEHSFAGDLGFRIYCPNNQFAQLDPNTHSGGNFLGLPAGGANHHSQDNGCLQQNNPAGTGWNYCWSELYPNNNMTFDQLSSSAAAGTVMVAGSRTIDSTNQINHTNYIMPQAPLSSLIGCPLNGVWNIEITDDYGSDNGYIFHWDLQLQANLMPTNWTYNVLVDSVIFNGPFLTTLSDTTASVTPTAGGIYTYNIGLVDEFGCIWDTSTTLKVIQMPTVNLGNDTAFCFGNKMTLNAGNPGATYTWDTPTGIYSTQIVETSDTIFLEVPNPLNYIVSASFSNTSGTLVCSDLDTIVVTINPMPSISYNITPPLGAGCEPLSITFSNETSPVIQNYLWNFGDGATDTATDPTHVFSAGTYTISLTATTLEGCTAISTIPNLIKSYPQPHAEFSWDPAIGVIQDPHINFTNLTVPNNPSFSYFWNFGDGGIDNTKDPVHIFGALGDYIITLIAISDKGCGDTVAHTVKIINDILEFPNIITPNNDNFNDKLVIKGLLDGGYPESELVIYNRWGKKVYSKNNYQNDFDGEGLADGVYFYIFKGKGILRESEHKGSLQIMR
jgi:gliding motility-associated-like protein